MIDSWLLDSWFKLHQSNLDWVFNAYEKMIKGLSLELQEKLSIKDKQPEPFVVLYGKTQVGKTTLLLDLLGVKHSKIGYVSHVLRGGRAAGQSATATAMEYCISEAEHWSLTINHKKTFYENESGMILALSKVRDEMEREAIIFNSHCVVGIPKHFFSDSDHNKVNIRILDLPGDNPANESEEKHVNKVAETYLPFADLILLVGRGDDLSFLKPEVLTLPGLDDWQVIPDRFRIVTTFSYTAHSIREQIRINDKFSINQIRARLIEQIERFGSLSRHAKKDDLFFPLEFGTSWKNIEKHDINLYRKINPIIKSLRDELILQIRESVTPSSRLRNLFNNQFRLEAVYDLKFKNLNEAVFNLEEKLNDVNKDIKSYKDIIKRYYVKLDRLKLLISECDNGFEIICDGDAFYKVDIDIDVLKRNKSVSKLKELIVNYSFHLKSVDFFIEKRGFNEGVMLLKPFFSKPGRREVEEVISNKLNEVRIMLNEYYFDRYLSASNFEKDVVLVKKNIESANKSIEKVWRKAWEAAIYKYKCSLIKDLKRTDASIANFKRELSYLYTQRKNYGDEHREICKNYKVYEDRKKRDFKVFNRLNEILVEEYNDEYSRQYEKLFADEDAADSLLKLISLTELTENKDNVNIFNG
ncbi:hypothetical protein AUR67_07750 [Pseudoalteromonas sp. XI10]|uniref:hypothetical protein n=1 Tax=Pseudoalteromonas sp. XI10 TaxID=1766621 RepID=UPI0007337FDB|nr:hypothetical protein [Pseudoalteromonas sp. XI10]KTG21223.1 hypothetical protein AUR67_07750 [Pseudoalteromonas sp. XI10]